MVKIKIMVMVLLSSILKKEQLKVKLLVISKTLRDLVYSLVNIFLHYIYLQK